MRQNSKASPVAVLLQSVSMMLVLGVGVLSGGCASEGGGGGAAPRGGSVVLKRDLSNMVDGDFYHAVLGNIDLGGDDPKAWCASAAEVVRGAVAAHRKAFAKLSPEDQQQQLIEIATAAEGGKARAITYGDHNLNEVARFLMEWNGRLYPALVVDEELMNVSSISPGEVPAPDPHAALAELTPAYVEVVVQQAGVQAAAPVHVSERAAYHRRLLIQLSQPPQGIGGPSLAGFSSVQRGNLDALRQQFVKARASGGVNSAAGAFYGHEFAKVVLEWAARETKDNAKREEYHKLEEREQAILASLRQKNPQLHL